MAREIPFVDACDSASDRLDILPSWNPPSTIIDDLKKLRDKLCELRAVVDRLSLLYDKSGRDVCEGESRGTCNC